MRSFVLQRCAGNLQDDLVLLPNDKPENEKKLFSRCDEMVFFFFFFNRHCNPSGFWPAQLFSAGRFLQSSVASGTSNPQLGGPVIRTFQLPPPHLKRRERTPAAEGGTMGEKLPKVATSTSLLSENCHSVPYFDYVIHSYQQQFTFDTQKYSPHLLRHLQAALRQHF